MTDRAGWAGEWPFARIRGGADRCRRRGAHEVITALVTARLTERRETRARLFDVRRQVYVEALRAVSIARHAVTDPIPDDMGVSVAQSSMFMAQLELLGTPEVHRAYGELMVPLVEAVERRATLPHDATVEDYEGLYSSER
jgi:hypothetical protein